MESTTKNLEYNGICAPDNFRELEYCDLQEYVKSIRNMGHSTPRLNSKRRVLADYLEYFFLNNGTNVGYGDEAVEYSIIDDETGTVHIVHASGEEELKHIAEYSLDLAFYSYQEVDSREVEEELDYPPIPPTQQLYRVFSEELDYYDVEYGEDADDAKMKCALRIGRPVEKLTARIYF